MRRPSSSSMAFAYSARLSRCSATRPGFGLRRGGFVESALQPRHETVDGGLIRPRAAGRRHHAAAQLAHRLFPHVRVLGELREIQRVERDVGGLGALVVTRHAVPDRGAHVRETWDRRWRGRLLQGTPAASQRSTQHTLNTQRTQNNRLCEFCDFCVDRRRFILLAFRRCHRARGRAATCFDSCGHEQRPDSPTARRNSLVGAAAMMSFGPDALLHHFREPIHHRGEHVVLRLQTGARLDRSRSRARCACRRSPDRAASCWRPAIRRASRRWCNRRSDIRPPRARRRRRGRLPRGRTRRSRRRCAPGPGDRTRSRSVPNVILSEV